MNGIRITLLVFLGLLARLAEAEDANRLSDAERRGQLQALRAYSDSLGV